MYCCFPATTAGAAATLGSTAAFYSLGVFLHLTTVMGALGAGDGRQPAAAKPPLYNTLHAYTTMSECYSVKH